MDDHTAYVELLAELTAMGEAPTDQGGAALCMVGTRYMWGRFGAEYIEAHYAIRVAAEDVLREWARAQENDDVDGASLMVREPRTGGVIIWAAYWDGTKHLGTGPTLAVALLDAVRRVRVRGMKENRSE